MADIFKTFIKHMDGVNKAAVADAAARAMAEHCDQRIAEKEAQVERLTKAIKKIRKRCDGRLGPGRATAVNEIADICDSALKADAERGK